MSLPFDFEDLDHWFHKGLLVGRLRAQDGKGADSSRRALKSLLVGFVLAAVIEFITVFLFQKDLKFDALFGFPLFAVSLALAFGSFLVLLLACLWVLRAKVSPGVTFALTCYVFSGLAPTLMILLHEQLSEAIRLFMSRGDPSLPYFAAATVKLLFQDDASVFAITRAWILFLLEIAAAFWYVIWQLRRVLIESCDCSHRELKATIALVLAIALNSLFFRFYAGRLYWSILGRLLSH